MYERYSLWVRFHIEYFFSKCNIFEWILIRLNKTDSRYCSIIYIHGIYGFNIFIVQFEIENIQIEPQPFFIRWFWHRNRSNVDKITQNHLRRSFSMFFPDFDKSWMVEVYFWLPWFSRCSRGRSKRTVSCDCDVVIFTELYEMLLVEMRIHLKLKSSLSN